MSHILFYFKMVMKEQTGKPPIHKNMPHMTGCLKWSKELGDRITAPMASYKRIEHP